MRVESVCDAPRYENDGGIGAYLDAIVAVAAAAAAAAAVIVAVIVVVEGEDGEEVGWTLFTCALVFRFEGYFLKDFRSWPLSS